MLAVVLESKDGKEGCTMATAALGGGSDGEAIVGNCTC